MVNQDLGRVAVVARGAYDPSTVYERLDAVSYNGSSYLVRKHCQGVEPAEGEYYMLMAKAGDSTAANAAAAEALAAAGRAAAASKRADTAAGSAEQQAAAAGAAAVAANAAAAAAQDVVDSVQPDIAQVKQVLSAHGEALDNRIKKFYTGNLGTVNIADSDDGAVRNLVIGGRSEQISTNGYQLLDYATFAGDELRGVKTDILQDGSVHISGTSTESGWCGRTFLPNLVITPGTYVFQVFGNHPKIAILTADWHSIVDLASSQSSAIFTVDSDKIAKHMCCYSSVAGEEFEFTVKFMLENGGTAHDWEPYTGGAPSPSPDYPQEIRSVENCAMTVSNAGGTETQTAMIPVTLRGIGDVRDELYVYADGSGKLVRRYPETLDPTRTVAEQAMDTPVETTLTAEQVKALFDLRTYYGGTNISYQSENGVEPVVNFDYACALENFVEYIKAAQGDDRKFIYDMDERMTDAEYVAALAYVNSEYAAALTELEV